MKRSHNEVIDSWHQERAKFERFVREDEKRVRECQNPETLVFLRRIQASNEWFLNRIENLINHYQG